MRLDNRGLTRRVGRRSAGWGTIYSELAHRRGDMVKLRVELRRWYKARQALLPDIAMLKRVEQNVWEELQHERAELYACQEELNIKTIEHDQVKAKIAETQEYLDLITEALDSLQFDTQQDCQVLEQDAYLQLDDARSELISATARLELMELSDWTDLTQVCAYADSADYRVEVAEDLLLLAREPLTQRRQLLYDVADMAEVVGEAEAERAELDGHYEGLGEEMNDLIWSVTITQEAIDIRQLRCELLWRELQLKQQALHQAELAIAFIQRDLDELQATVDYLSSCLD